MRQRVGFARAEPDLCCWTNPSPPSISLLRKNWGETAGAVGDNRLRTRAMVMVTHDVEEAVLMSDRVLIPDATSKRSDDELASISCVRRATGKSLRHLTDRIRSCLYKNRAAQSAG